jgi:hypothetical protein
MNEFFTYDVMLGTLILVYIYFIIMLTELQRVLSQELKCLYSKITKITTVLLELTVPKTVDVSLTFLLYSK